MYEEDNNETRVAAPTICSIPIEGINPTFDPNRTLLRRVFFLNEDRNKYVSWHSTRRKDIQLM